MKLFRFIFVLPLVCLVLGLVKLSDWILGDDDDE